MSSKQAAGSLSDLDNASLSTAYSTTTLTSLPDLNEKKYTTQNAGKWPSCLYTTESSYLVVMKTDAEGFSPKQRADHLDAVQQLCRDKNNAFWGIQMGPKDLEEVYPAAYMGIFPPDVVSKIQGAAAVRSVIKNANNLKPANAIPDWSHSKASLAPDGYAAALKSSDWTRSYGSQGQDANIFIIDGEGFDPYDFKDPQRIKCGYHFGSARGHGTVVTNLAAGDTLGAAPLASVYPFVGGFAHLAIIKGFNEAMGEHKKANKRITVPGIVNCSWNRDFGKDVQATEEVLKIMLVAQKAGLVVNLAAGNEGGNWDEQRLTYHGPQPSLNLIGSMDKNGFPAVHTNYGSKVSVYAPGIDLIVTRKGEKADGTSCATALFSGYLANLLTARVSTNPDPERTNSLIKSLAVVTDLLELQPGDKPINLSTLGPKVIHTDFVIWPLSILKPIRKLRNDKGEVTGTYWEADHVYDTKVAGEGGGEKWSVRGVSAPAQTKTTIITNEMLANFVKLLEQAFAEADWSIFKRYWQDTLGLEPSLSTVRHGKIWVGTNFLDVSQNNYQYGFHLKNLQDIARFIRRNMGVARDRKVSSPRKNWD